MLFAISIGSVLLTTAIHFSLLALRSQQSQWNRIDELRIAYQGTRLLIEDIDRSPLRQQTFDKLPMQPPWIIQAWDHEILYTYRSTQTGDTLYRKVSHSENQILPQGWKAEAENKKGTTIIHWRSPQGNIYRIPINPP